MLRSGKVYVQNIYAGKICETEDGYEFCYDTEYLSMENAAKCIVDFLLLTPAQF
ncbi:hypothetical protein [Butyrivibrio sp. JL13D10]|uniref:hypothetical protein n=1 Tax=Butyrivibrio sp. JL13D10 TaxID=3236815 RepID=UPI0038B4BFBE